MEEIEREIEKLQTKLAELKSSVDTPPKSNIDRPNEARNKSQAAPQPEERDIEIEPSSTVISGTSKLNGVQTRDISVRALVIFPFALGTRLEKNKTLGILKHILNAVQDQDMKLHDHQAGLPILFVNRVSQVKGHLKEIEDFLQSDQHRNKWEIVTGWSVDTCQDWLYGWGRIIDDWQKDNQDQNSLGLLQIPGDLTDVGASSDSTSIRKFLIQLGQLKGLVKGGEDFVIGDYRTKQIGGKYLIDTYGTFPLLYNWFPQVARQIRTELDIERPRSEFIAANVNFMKTMLINHRRFAYEQTTAILINALLYSDKLEKEIGHKPKIERVNLGEIKDHTGARGFREALEQLERMERMMRLLWRVVHGGDKFDIKEYSRLDKRSAAIRDAAMVTFRNFLRSTRE